MTFRQLLDYIGKKMPKREGDVENPRGGLQTGLVAHPDCVPTANNRFTDAGDPDVLGGVVVCQSHGKKQDSA